MKMKVLLVEIEGTAVEVIGQIVQILYAVKPDGDPRLEETDMPAPAPQPALETVPRLLPRHIPDDAPTANRKALVKATRKPQTLTPVALIDWGKYPQRTALAELSPCAICHRRIIKGDSYHDGATESRRAHCDCVADLKRTPAHG